MFEKISRKFGFTETELWVVIFIVGSFLVGYSFKLFSIKENGLKVFDYSQKDSLFLSLTSDSILTKNFKINKSNIDSKPEVLDFNGTDFKSPKAKIVLAKKSVNLNTATVSDFMKLPGIGKKTAEAIIKYRKQIDKFERLTQILNVKGIASAKFEKIKEYIFIENK